MVGLVAAALGATALGSAGCKENAERAAPDPAALRAQQALIARREAMLATRKQTQEEKKKLQEEMRRTAESGGDTSEMQNKMAELDSQLEVQNNQLADEFQALSTKLDTIAAATAATSDQSAGIATREADVGSREDRLAQREERVAAREAKVAEREQRDALACAAASTTTIVQQVPAPTKTSYSRKEIDGLLGRARSAMGKRGLLGSDLPAHAQGLEREATSAMADGELGKAYLAASQLASTVDAVKIDSAFVKAKVSRLQGRISAKGGKLDEATNKNMGAGIADVMQKWGDGDYGKANAKLNQLYGALD
jgi:chromosome segregation ATPase